MNMNWLNTNYILRAGVLSVLLLLPGLISATCKADTIITTRTRLIHSVSLSKMIQLSLFAQEILYLRSSERTLYCRLHRSR